MPKGVIDNNKIYCPSCNSREYTVYRRESGEDARIICLARCSKCDTTFSFTLDRYDVPISDDDSDNSPELPFEAKD